MTLTWKEPELLDKFCGMMIDAVSFRDPTTRVHSKSVRALSMVLAMEIGAFQDEQMMQVLGWSALLHDVGKIGINDAVLNKAKPLTDGEWGMMRQHTRMGHDLVATLGTWQEIQDVALYHHENVDGSGYPCQLQGDQIPLMARIVRVADVYEAMTAYRSYREVAQFSADEALDLMQAHAKLYDPTILRALMAVIKRRPQ